MQTPINIQFHQMEKSEAVIERLTDKIDELENKFGPFISCNIIIEQENKNQNQGRLFKIKINLNLPKKEILVNHQKDEDIFIVVRDAIASLNRQVEDHDRKRHDSKIEHGKIHEETLSGQVIKLFKDESYGFILRNDDEYYFSATNIHDGDFNHIKLGDEVRFIEAVADEGLQAHRVSLPKRHQ
jgi:ribosomal subunit interface protein